MEPDEAAEQQPDTDPAGHELTPEQLIANVRAAKAQVVAARQGFRASLRAAKGRVSANVLADEAQGIMSRPVVLRVLGEESLEDKARRLLGAAGYDPIDVLVLTSRGATTLDLVGETSVGSYVKRYNAAGAVLHTLRQGGVEARAEGWIDLAEALAQGSTVRLYDLAP